MKKINLFFAFITVYFSVFSQAPTITSFSPDSGSVGTLITIVGTNLESPTAFTVGGISVIVISASPDTLVGMVMPGTMSGVVSIATAEGTDTASIFNITPTPYPGIQQGHKLVGTGTEGLALQGTSVAISADGNTAIVGGPDNDSLTGAAWVYTRSGGIWTQMGVKLVGTGAINTGTNYGIHEGTSVAISADGNTVIVGGPNDNNLTGAAWVYTRSGGSWTQQGSKLVGTGETGAPNQGGSVALSADGNTAILGGPNDNSGIGAIWIFTRSGGSWTQQGDKLVGTNAIPIGSGVNQGFSVSLSADGNTTIVGGYSDNTNIGAAWVFVRSDTTWKQQGSKLVGTGAAGISAQGSSVSISADGNTAIVGGYWDGHNTGAAWVYTRSDTIWTQQGSKLVGSGTLGTGAFQGQSVSLSADGNTALLGGPNDNYNALGATWVFTRSNSTWTQQGKLVGTGAVAFEGDGVFQGYSLALSADGSTALVGGYNDNTGVGASWIFVPCSPMSSIVYDTIPVDSLPYQWNGLIFNDSFPYFGDEEVYTGADSQTAQLISSGGCDSMTTLVLSISCTPDSVSMYQNICSCFLPYQWFGLIFNDADTQTAHLTGIGGCDIVATLILTVFPGSISEKPSQSPIHLYPNPNRGSFTLQTSNSIGSDFTISDMLGHVILHQSIRSDNETIELPDAAEGVYTLAVRGVDLPSAGQPLRFVIVR